MYEIRNNVNIIMAKYIHIMKFDEKRNNVNIMVWRLHIINELSQMMNITHGCTRYYVDKCMVVYINKDIWTIYLDIN